MLRITAFSAAILMSAITLSAAPPLIDRTLPAEVVDENGAALDPTVPGSFPLDFFDDFSWQSFIALNWPAKEGVRGVAHETKTLNDPGPRVWETWKAAYELVPKDLNPPDPAMPSVFEPTEWDSFDARTPCPDIDRVGSGKKRVLGVWKPFGDFNQVGFGEDDLQGPLVCQNATYTRFEVRVNREEFNFIRDNKLYLRSKIKTLTKPVKFTPGSIEVKAAWRELEESMPAAEVETYYHIEANVYDAVTMTCAKRRIGLVGMHIVHKTPLRPQWVWSSFEHVRNVPLPGATPATTEQFSYNSPTKPQMLDSPPDPITPANPPATPPTRTQVIRKKPLHPAGNGSIGTVATNERYQAALAGTVWKNYMLVVTQWPTKTKDPSLEFPENILGDPFPATSATSVANTTMETYLQSGTSCMRCHDTARDSNLDFVFFLDFHAFNDTGLAGVKPITAAKLKLKLEQILVAP